MKHAEAARKKKEVFEYMVAIKDVSTFYWTINHFTSQLGSAAKGKGSWREGEIDAEREKGGKMK